MPCSLFLPLPFGSCGYSKCLRGTEGSQSVDTTTRLNMPYVHIWAGDGAQLTEYLPSTHRGLSSVGNAE